VELATSRRRSRVLLVEDDLGDAFLVRELLEEVDAPVDLTVVRTIAEAKAQLSQFDCVLLDLELPDASGLDALRQLIQARSHAAVCVLTGLSEEHLGEAALAHGAQDYLVKGRVDGVLLERAIRYAVERRRAEDGALLLREAEFRQAESSRLERGLLPHPLLDDAAVGLRGFYRAGRQMGVLGGDFYDAVQTGPNRVSVVVGDVCGHAAEEAALGVELRVAWRALTLAGVGEDQLLATLERILTSERRAEEIFATMATVTVDSAAGTCRVRTTGHPPPVLITSDGARPLTLAQSIVLGLLPGAASNATEITLPDRPWGILAYTDGLIEARDGSEWLGTNGLCQLIDSYMGSGTDSDGLPEWLVAEAERRNGGPLADDVAMLLLTGDGARRSAEALVQRKAAAAKIVNTGPQSAMSGR
jgi:serine phosphatase RsbU (regulator of sigma subunit)